MAQQNSGSGNATGPSLLLVQVLPPPASVSAAGEWLFCKLLPHSSFRSILF